MTRIDIKEAVVLNERLKNFQKALRNCPVCFGTGEFDTMSNMGPDVPNCWVCKGQGFVNLDSICACGNAAVFLKDELLYCGRDVCLNSLKHRHKGGFGC